MANPRRLGKPSSQRPNAVRALQWPRVFTLNMSWLDKSHQIYSREAGWFSVSLPRNRSTAADAETC